MFGREATRWFTVQVLSTSGKLIKVRQCATSKWHAVELVYTRLRSQQPDRSKYKSGGRL